MYVPLDVAKILILLEQKIGLSHEKEKKTLTILFCMTFFLERLVATGKYLGITSRSRNIREICEQDLFSR